MASDNALRDKFGVFISYARSDGSNYALWLRRRLQKENPDIPRWQDLISERGGRGLVAVDLCQLVAKLSCCWRTHQPERQIRNP